MVDFNEILLDKLSEKTTEQELIFNRLPEESKQKIEVYVTLWIDIAVHSVFKQLGKKNPLGNFSEDEIIKMTESFKEIDDGFTHHERDIAAIRYKVFLEKKMRQATKIEGTLNDPFVAKTGFENAFELSCLIENMKGKFAVQKKPVEALKQKTVDKWRPYQNKYDELIAKGMKQSTAKHEIGKLIEKEIRNNPKTTPFKERPDRGTLTRQLVTNRK